MKKNYWGSRGLATWTAWAVVGVAAAQQTTPQGSQKLSIHIEAQPMAQALSELGDQTGLSIIVASTATDGVRAPAVDGSYTADEALRKVIVPAGLKAEYLSRTTVAVRVAQSDAAQPSSTSKEKKEPVSQESVQSKEKPTSDSTSAPATSDVSTSSKLQASEKKGIPEVLVKGTRFLNMDIKRSKDDIQPYVVFDRDAIEASGASSIQDFLMQRLTANTQPNAISQSPSQAFRGNSTSFNLRGLGTDQTLILIDGHRAVTYSIGGNPQQPDLNGIPLAAVERIEVLPTTSSGIYGGSATGGVINIVLRHSYSGAEAKLGYWDTYDGGGAKKQVDIAGGFNSQDGRTNVLLGGSYSKSDPLTAGERQFIQTGREVVLVNSPATLLSATTTPLGSGVNIRSTTGANLLLKNGTQLSAPFTYAPPGYSGTSADLSSLATNAGKYSLGLAPTAASSGAAETSLIGNPTVESVMATIRHEFAPSLQAFIDLGASSNESYFQTNNAATTVTLPASSPINPFSQSIVVATPAEGADGTVVTKNGNVRAVVGVIAKISDTWSAEADYTWNRAHFSDSTPGGLLSSAATAAAGGALDILSSSANLSAYVAAPTVAHPTNSTLKDVSVRAAGTIAPLPAGSVVLSTLLEHRDELFSDSTATSQSAGGQLNDTYYPPRSQAVNSVYLEARVPIFSELFSFPALHELEFQIAGRHDEYKEDTANGSINLLSPANVVRYSQKLSSTDPTVGLKFKPISAVMFRASYGTGFKPPSVIDLAPSPSAVISAATASLIHLTDPRRGNTPIGSFTYLLGGSPSLEPEESTSRSAGVVLTPERLQGLRLSADWTDISKKNGIVSLPLAENYIQDELLVPGLIERGPVPANDPYGVGPITAFNGALINVARLKTDVYDFELDYAKSLESVGSLGLSAAATRLVHSTLVVAPGAPVVENAGLVSDLKWRGNATLDWRKGGWTVAWTARYYDSYWLNVNHTVVATQGSSMVPSQIYHDVFVSYHFGTAWHALNGALANSDIQVGAQNVFNKQPPVDTTATITGFFYSGLADPRLGTWYVSFRKAM